MSLLLYVIMSDDEGSGFADGEAEESSDSSSESSDEEDEGNGGMKDISK